MDFAVFLLMVGCRIDFIEKCGLLSQGFRCISSNGWLYDSILLRSVDFSLMDFAVFLLMVGCRIVFH